MQRNRPASRYNWGRAQNRAVQRPNGVGADDTPNFVTGADGAPLTPQKGFENFVEWARDALYPDIVTRGDMDCGERFIPVAASIPFATPETATNIIIDFLPTLAPLSAAFHDHLETIRAEVVDRYLVGMLAAELPHYFDMQTIFWGLIYDVLSKYRFIPTALIEVSLCLSQICEMIEVALETSVDEAMEYIFRVGTYCVEVLRWRGEGGMTVDGAVAHVKSKRPPFVTD